MSEILDANIIVNGQKSIATVEQAGEMIESNGVLDANCIVQTANGPQKAIKTYPIGSGGAKIEFVPELPSTGEKGTLYMVQTGVTRDGYAIFQEFTWNDTTSEWIAVGAYDTTIITTGLVYERGFNATTGAWTVGVNQ